MSEQIIDTYNKAKRANPREIKEIDVCPACGCRALVFNNKGNQEAWATCFDCLTETPLEFNEPYSGKRHKRMLIANYTHGYVNRFVKKGHG
jgi:hypothetical protein